MNYSQFNAILAKKTALKDQTVDDIVNCFSSLAIRRLLIGESVVIPSIGEIYTYIEKEYIAVLPDGRRLIVPPQVRFALRNYKKEDFGLPALLLFESDLFTHDALDVFLLQISEQTQYFIHLSEEVEWKGIGFFSIKDKLISFRPDPLLVEEINRPFNCFEITPLSDGKSFPQLREILVTGENQLLFHPIVHLKEELPVALDENFPTTLLPENPDNIVPALPPNDTAPLTGDARVNPAQVTPPHGREISESYPKQNRRSRRFVFPLLFLSFFFLLLGVFFYFHHQRERKEYARALTADPIQKEQEEKVFSSEEIPEKKDTITASTPIVTERFVEMRPNETMTQLALREYGYKAFWVYIYEANKSIIKNPDRVPPGTRLRIPDPAEYAINKNSAESRRKADSIQRAYNLSKGRI